MHEFNIFAQLYFFENGFYYIEHSLTLFNQWSSPSLVLFE